MLNFSGAKMPKFKFWSEESVDKAQAERDSILSGTGQLKFTKQYFQKTYGFEDDDITVSETVNPTPSAEEPPQEFAEQLQPEKPADEIDALVASLDPEVLQKQMNGILKPVIELIEKGESFEEIMADLVKTYDGMSNEALIEMLERAFFVTEVWGRINGTR
jgi:phage gp29-like protein